MEQRNTLRFATLRVKWKTALKYIEWLVTHHIISRITENLSTCPGFSVQVFRASVYYECNFVTHSCVSSVYGLHQLLAVALQLLINFKHEFVIHCITDNRSFVHLAFSMGPLCFIYTGLFLDLGMYD